MNLRESTLKRIVQLMKEPQHGLVIKDRTFHFHVFPDCFVGNEFVTWCLHNNTVDTREHAAMLGQDLLDRGIIYHASNDQPFKDGYFFYTFQKFPEISDAELDIIVIRMKAHPTGVSIQDRTHHLRSYRDCFVGKEAVDWFVNNVPKYATSRQVAVKLGQELMNKGVVHSANHQPFSDSVDFYYFQVSFETGGTEEKPVYAGYLGKLTKTGTDWKIRWFSIKDIREKKLWYFNSPRDPAPRDFIPLVDACVRVVLEQDIGFMEICTPMRVFTLRPTSSTLLARWVRVLSDFIGAEGCEDNSRIERAERSVSVHESRASSNAMRERRLVSLSPSLTEMAESELLLEGADHPPPPPSTLSYPSSSPSPSLPSSLPSHQPPPPKPLPPRLEKRSSLEQREQHDSSSSSSSFIHDSQPSAFGDDTSMDNLANLSRKSLESLENFETLETLDLMYDDDLEFDIEDDMFLPRRENGQQSNNSNFTSTSELLLVQTKEKEEEREEGEKDGGLYGGMSMEQRATLTRIKEQLFSTSSQDANFTTTTTTSSSSSSLSLLPSMTYDEMQLPPPKSKHGTWDNFHIV